MESIKHFTLLTAFFNLLSYIDNVFSEQLLHVHLVSGFVVRRTRGNIIVHVLFCFLLLFNPVTVVVLERAIRVVVGGEFVGRLIR